MKIITESGIYIQKNDLGCLSEVNLPIPASIYLKLLENGSIIIDDRNRYDFVKFEKPEEIEFLSRQDWILDYNEIKDLEEEQIIELAGVINTERNSIASKYNSMSNNEKEQNQSLVSQCELLEYKFYSLRDFLWFKQGHISMNLPKEVTGTKKAKEGCLKKLVKTFKQKKDI